MEKKKTIMREGINSQCYINAQKAWVEKCGGQPHTVQRRPARIQQNISKLDFLSKIYYN
jgi:hypothetical protein